MEASIWFYLPDLEEFERLILAYFKTDPIIATLTVIGASIVIVWSTLTCCAYLESRLKGE